MIFAFIYIAMGLNFLLTVPTFEQFNIPKNFIGAGFALIGCIQLIVLNIYRRIKLVRTMLIISIGYAFFWGIGTTQTFFEGKSSLQLFVLYMGLGGLQIPLLLEPFYNPITSDDDLIELEKRDKD